MSLGDYLTGLGWFVLSTAPVAAGTALVARRRLRDLTGAPRGLALFVVALALLLAEHMIPLALGILTRATPGITGALLCLAAWRSLRARSSPRAGSPSVRETRPSSPRADPPSPPLAWLLAGVAAVAAAVSAVGYVAAVATQQFSAVDMVAFHLPGVVRWIQSGTVWEIAQYLPYQAQGYYPHNGDVVALAAMLPWHADFALRYVALPFVAATGVAVYALAAELGAPRAAAVLYGAVAVTIPSLAVSTLDFALPDAVMYATFATGTLFLARRARGGGRTDLVLAGVALGIGFGVKWYAVPAVVLVVAAWAGALLAARCPARAVAGDVARIAGLVAAFGGFWLVRNWIESGNPVFPVRIAPFGVTIFDAPYDRARELAGWTLGGYVDDPTILRRYAWPAFNETLGAAWIVLAAGALAAGAAAWRARPRATRVVIVVVAAVLVAVAYLFTPYSALGGENAPTGIQANTRYVVPALLLAAAATAWIAGRGRVLAIATYGAGALAVGDGLRRGFDPVGLHDLLVGAVVVGVTTAAAILLRQALPETSASPTGGTARRTLRVTALAAIGVGVFAGLAGGGYEVQRRFADNRYRGVEAPLAWVRDARERRVALAGQWSVDGLYPVFPAFGPRLVNTVAFVGPVREDMLVEYTNRADFARALRKGDYDLLLVGTATLPGIPRGDFETWARAAGYAPVARSPRLILLAPR